MSVLKIATLQTDIIWESPAENRSKLEQIILGINEPVDLIVLPETFSTGFSMNTSLSETIDGETMQWLSGLAQQKQAVICGSIMLKDKHQDVYNRLIWMKPEGSYYAYNKKHLFSIGQENNHYKPGNQKVIVEINGFKILLAVCYDLRFPVWLRRTPKADYDAILMVANWPERRAEHWNALLKARAIENQCYVVAVNRVGQDGNSVNHSGDTQIIHPNGKVNYHCSQRAEMAINSIHLNEVQQYRNDFPVWNDADRFELL